MELAVVLEYGYRRAVSNRRAVSRDLSPLSSQDVRYVPELRAHWIAYVVLVIRYNFRAHRLILSEHRSNLGIQNAGLGKVSSPS
jgi:hypothetical protein